MSTQTQEDELIVFSDYVCPFCYLGKAAMDQYLDSKDDPPEVQWHLYDLRGYKRNPDGSIDSDVDDGKDEDYFEQARENVRQLKEEYDVEMDVEASMEVDSWNAQQVALYVREELGEDAFLRLHERLFDAHWQDGLDIGDPDVLRDLVAEVDLEDDVVDAALTSEWDEKLRERFDAAQEAGVTGIPTFVYGEYSARGAIPPAQFERLVEGV
jgi:predicted DsbA family dithiol-disulfide isomerase